MADIPMVHYWKGTQIEDLPRDELLECTRYAMEELAKTRTPSAIRARALGSAEMLKRGEAYSHG